MPAKLYSALLLTSVLLAYIWFHSPYHTQFTLQLFTLSVAVFLVVKKLTKRIQVILPSFSSPEMVLLLWLFLLIIGSTTALEAITFPLVSIVLFLLVFTSPIYTSLLVSGSLLLFIVGLMPVITAEKALSLLLIPILLVVYFFAKKQYVSSTQQKTIIAKEEENIMQLTLKDSDEQYFVYSYVLPKLQTIRDLTQQPQEQNTVVINQLDLVIAEIEKRKNKATSATT